MLVAFESVFSCQAIDKTTDYRRTFIGFNIENFRCPQASRQTLIASMKMLYLIRY